MEEKGSKAKKIVIAVVAIIAVIAIVLGILIATKVIDINLSKKSKVIAGMEKLGDSFTEPLDKVAEMSEKNGVTPKILDNFSVESGMEVSSELSANIEKLEIDGLRASQKSTVNDVIKLINSAKFGVDVRYDGNESAYLKINGQAEDAKVSAEVVYDGSQLGVRSEEINEEWLAIKKSELEDLAEDAGVDFDEIKDMINAVMKNADKLVDALEIDEKTQKDIEKRYKKVLEDFIKDKSKEIKSDSAKVSVDGKNKSCKKLTLKLDDKDLVKLLKAYLNAFQKDDQLRGILDNYTNALADVVKDMGADVDVDDMKEMIDQIYENMDDITDSLDDVEFEGTVSLVVYATATKVYKTDIIFEDEDVEVAIETTFNKESTVMELNVEAYDEKMDVGTLTLTEKDNGLTIKIEAGDGLVDELGFEGSIEIDYTIDTSKEEVAIKVDAGEYGSGTLSVKMDIAKNEEKEFEATTTMTLELDIPDMVAAKASITEKSAMKVGSATIPSMDKSVSIINRGEVDQEALTKYITDSIGNVGELIESLKSIEMLEPYADEIDAIVKELNTQPTENNDNTTDPANNTTTEGNEVTENNTANATNDNNTVGE